MIRSDGPPGNRFLSGPMTVTWKSSWLNSAVLMPDRGQKRRPRSPPSNFAFFQPSTSRSLCQSSLLLLRLCASTFRTPRESDRECVPHRLHFSFSDHPERDRFFLSPVPLPGGASP